VEGEGTLPADHRRASESKAPAAARKPERRLWIREQLNAIPPADLGAAAEAISARLRTVLVRWIGTDACHTLMQRALDDVKPTHPALIGARCDPGCVVVLATDGAVHQPGAVRDGFIALVEALGDRLGRVVGEEMAWRLVEQAEPPLGVSAPGSNE
jgi:hypothetical protein